MQSRGCVGRGLRASNQRQRVRIFQEGGQRGGRVGLNWRESLHSHGRWELVPVAGWCFGMAPAEAVRQHHAANAAARTDGHASRGWRERLGHESTSRVDHDVERKLVWCSVFCMAVAVSGWWRWNGSAHAHHAHSDRTLRCVLTGQWRGGERQDWRGFRGGVGQGHRSAPDDLARGERDSDVAGWEGVHCDDSGQVGQGRGRLRR
mmetsp:Transcript_39934/g.94784  ORF Transcript_39934/g.94784 Transcript_39934/m.94784 type:complete len:205 (-) Transcript_39934:485-1099(-)